MAPLNCCFSLEEAQRNILLNIPVLSAKQGLKDFLNIKVKEKTHTVKSDNTGNSCFSYRKPSESFSGTLTAEQYL